MQAYVVRNRFALILSLSHIKLHKPLQILTACTYILYNAAITYIYNADNIRQTVLECL